MHEFDEYCYGKTLEELKEEHIYIKYILVIVIF